MYRKMNNRGRDPFWLTGKFGNCKECGTSLKGKRTFYYPSDKSAFCEKCGESHSLEFNSMVQDENNYNSQY